MKIVIKLLYTLTVIQLIPLYTNATVVSCQQYAHKRYNEVMFAAAHNGQSCKPSAVRNQDCSIAIQLKQGIRAIKIPVWYGIDKQGKRILYACHGVSKTLLHDAYLGNMLNKVPWAFRPFAKKVFNSISPINQMVVDALAVAYGSSDEQNGVIPFNHAILDPSARPLFKVFADVGTFLTQNPHEIVTLILEDFTNNRAAIAAAVHLGGVYSLVHTQPLDQPWPTIGKMIQDNNRLVIFVRSENDHSPKENYPWLHDLWSFAWDTKWDFKKISDFKHDSIPNRGVEAFETRNAGPSNKLFIVYHFITPLTGGSKHWAMKVNRTSVLQPRLRSLWKQAGHIPNFIQVDFFEYPNNDIFTVVNRMNQ